MKAAPPQTIGRCASSYSVVSEGLGALKGRLIFALLMSCTIGRLEPLLHSKRSMCLRPVSPRSRMSPETASRSAMFQLARWCIAGLYSTWNDGRRATLPRGRHGLLGARASPCTSLHGNFTSRADGAVRQGSMPLPTPGRCVGTGARLQQLMIVIAGERAHGDPRLCLSACEPQDSVVEDAIIIGLDLRKILDLEGAVTRRYSQVDVLAPGAQCLRCRGP